MFNRRREADLRHTLDDVTRLLERHTALEEWAHRQETPNRDLVEQLQHRQNVAELQRRIRSLHPADLAYVLESLPRDERILIWHEAEPQQAAEALVEVDAAVRQSLIDATDRRRLVEILRSLDLDDLAWLSEFVPEEILREVARSLGDIDKSLLEQSIAYPEDSVGELMTREVAVVRESQTVADVLADLRTRDVLPEQTDRLFVVDARNVLRGAVGLQTLVIGQEAATIDTLMDRDPLSFAPEDPAGDAANAFERYNLLSAPVVNERGKLIGRVTVDAVMDYIRAAAESEALAMAGLRGAEDLFAPVWEAARNRGPWLFVNLVTAFVATRFIGLFEGTIQQLVALATLMPIVASVGGNTGNQTVALVIRGLALEQVSPSALNHLLRKELTVGLLNGVLWGGLVGAFAGAIYGHLWLGLVMTAAVLLNLVIAATAGVLVPIALDRMGRDPAQGASVLLTFITDSMG
ncbi:MAG: magnesium transporter, partial [Vicinamibacterales bacterium]